MAMSTGDGSPTSISAFGERRLFVFDCDGTLIDSQHTIIAAVEKVFRSIDVLPPDPLLIRQQVGLPPEAAIARMLPMADAALHRRVIEAFKSLQPQLQTEPRDLEPLYPGIRELINELVHPELFLGIATGKGRARLDASLRQHGLAGQFHTLQTGDRCRGKPDPDMLLRALAETGLDASDGVMIGDTTFDMEMARHAGFLAIGVAWGYHDPASLYAAGARAVINHPGDLLPALRRLQD
jgi:phosphoglycolate phosphatase